MPLRRLLEPAAAGSRACGRTRGRAFHSSSSTRLQAAAASHYETLGVPVDASQAVIKRQFYALSKQHHPDLHPEDPTASARFQALSTAYRTLSEPAARARYDHEAGIMPQGAHTPTGSHSSAQARSGTGGPFGARPASGLSKRRTTFRGPPPSFYRAGGWGAQAEKRRAAQGGDGPGAGASVGHDSAGGFSPGQGTADNDVPHFDRQAHFERQEEIDSRMLQRRRARQRRERAERDYADKEFAARFILIGSLVFGGWLASLSFSRG